jgi:putative acetyltransferase
MPIGTQLRYTPMHEANKLESHKKFNNLFLNMGFAPMAVLPEFQCAGVGSLLCREIGFKAVVVLGHPDYYPRFGFMPASSFGIKSEYNVPDEVFMLMEIQTGYLHGIFATIHYHAAFSGV